MATLTIELPSQASQTEFNLKRWAELVADPALAKIEGRIETNRHGQIIMSPPPAANHGGFQLQIGAKEVWICSKTGAMSFFEADNVRPIRKSKLGPEFPAKVTLR